MFKRSLLVGATVATVTLGGGSWAMAATTGDTGNNVTLAQKIAAKFGLNASEVQTVIDQNRQEKDAAREANFKTNLATAVKTGKLTQTQADHITDVMGQIDTLRAGKPMGELDQSTRDQIKQHMKDLRQWAKDNKVSMRFVFAADHDGRGMGRLKHVGSNAKTSSNSSSSADSSDVQSN